MNLSRQQRYATSAIQSGKYAVCLSSILVNECYHRGDAAGEFKLAITSKPSLEEFLSTGARGPAISSKISTRYFGQL